MERLRTVVKSKKIPKGAWLRLWRDQKRTHECWILELNRNEQPDGAPKKGAVDSLIRIPIRIIHDRNIIDELK